MNKYNNVTILYQMFDWRISCAYFPVPMVIAVLQLWILSILFQDIENDSAFQQAVRTSHGRRKPPAPVVSSYYWLKEHGSEAKLPWLLTKTNRVCQEYS